MSEAKVGLSANVRIEVVRLSMAVLRFVNAFGFECAVGSNGTKLSACFGSPFPE